MASPALQLGHSPGITPADMCHSWNAGALHPQTSFWLNWGYPGSAEKRLQSWFSHLNFWFSSKSQKMQPTLSNSQDVDAARQFLAHWTTTAYFLDQEDIPETNLLWFRPRWQISGAVRLLPLLELLPGNEVHSFQSVLILLHYQNVAIVNCNFF